ncbi:MAG: hypothetical protein LRY32_01020 [Flavobacterium sp.]|nr:hypothetical protein [Flavobacterium sp.]
MRDEQKIAFLKFIDGLDNQASIFNIGEHSFNYNQLKAIQKKLLNSQRVLEQFGINVKENLSIRRALIVLLQEKYYPLKTYDEIDINLEQLIKQAKVRFQIENRSINKLNTPQAIHPKNPCLHYEDSPLEKGHYKNALKLLVNPSSLFFQ